MFEWRVLSEERVKLELKGALWRNEIEEEMFTIVFTKEPCKGFKDRIQKQEYYEENPYKISAQKQLVRRLKTFVDERRRKE